MMRRIPTVSAAADYGDDDEHEHEDGMDAYFDTIDAKLTA
jgi:hypothetical protein